jgi:type I restriction enzyme, S subunit
MSSAAVNTLPDGWKNKELGEICDVVGGGTPKTKVSEYWDGEIVWLSPIDLPPIGEISIVSDSRKKITDFGLQKSSAKLLPKGSVIYSTRASIGKIAIAEIPLSTNQGFTNFICKEQISNYFLCYALKHYNKNIEELSNSTTFKEVSKSAIKSFKIPLPPLKEQKRIVAKIDTLFAKIDKAIRLTEESLKQAENLFISSLSQKFDDLKQLYKSFPLMKFVDFIGGSQPPKSSFSYEFKEGFIRLIQIRDYKTDNHIVYIHQDSTKKLCEADDVMIGRYGPPVFQILRGIKGAYNVALMKAIPNESMVSKDFLFYFLQNSSIQNYIISISQRSAGQSGVNKKALEAYSIVLPPLDVQSKYVGIFNQLQSSSEETQSKLEEQLVYLKQLKSSILSKAFKGEL